MTELPQNLLTSETVREGFEAAADWALVAGEALQDDAVNCVQGTQGIKLVTADGVTGNWTKNGAWDFSGDDQIRLWVHFDGVETNEILKPRLVLQTSAKNYWQYQNLNPFGGYSGWYCFHLAKSQFTQFGEPSWSNITQIALLCSDAGLHPTRTVDSLSGVVGVPAVVIGFDDNRSGVYTNAFPYMKAHNIVGTVYTITSKINKTGYMTTAQMQEMYAAGWDFANHTENHVKLDTQTEAEQETAIDNARAALDALGFTRASRHLSYPNGSYNADTLTAAAATGMLTGRRITDGYLNLPLVEPMRYLLHCSQFDTTEALDEARSRIDTAMERGQAIMFYVHDVEETPSGWWHISVGDFQGFIDYIVSSGIQPITISQFYDLQFGAVNVRQVR